MNLTLTQKLALAIAFLGFVSGASTQLTDILAPFGSNAPVIVKEIVSGATFLSGALGTFLAFITGQANQVKSVQEMPGVEKIVVNEKANSTLAAIAVDPTSKVEPTPEAAKTVEATAKEAA